MVKRDVWEIEGAVDAYAVDCGGVFVDYFVRDVSFDVAGGWTGDEGDGFFVGSFYGDECDLCDGAGGGGYVSALEHVWTSGDSFDDSGGRTGICDDWCQSASDDGEKD